jgi:hypothetical protein
VKGDRREKERGKIRHGKMFSRMKSKGFEVERLIDTNRSARPINGPDGRITGPL